MGSLFLVFIAAAASPAVPASAEGQATVRILTPALIGAGLPAPRPGMIARDTTVTLPDGRSAPIRLYEFE
ncbi:MAG: hypothetical protein ABIT69_10330 [Sphingomicrobium sp.]